MNISRHILSFVSPALLLLLVVGCDDKSPAKNPVAAKPKGPGLIRLQVTDTKEKGLTVNRISDGAPEALETGAPSYSMLKALKDAKAANPDVTAVVEIEPRLPYGQLEPVLMACSQAGIVPIELIVGPRKVKFNWPAKSIPSSLEVLIDQPTLTHFEATIGDIKTQDPKDVKAALVAQRDKLAKKWKSNDDLKIVMSPAKELRCELLIAVHAAIQDAGFGQVEYTRGH